MDSPPRSVYTWGTLHAPWALYNVIICGGPMPHIRARTASEDRVERLYEVARRIASQPDPSEADMREYARIAKGLSFSDYLRIEERESARAGDLVSAR